MGIEKNKLKETSSGLLLDTVELKGVTAYSNEWVGPRPTTRKVTIEFLVEMDLPDVKE